MPGEAHGEYIAIYWDDDAEFVRGHVSDDDARAACRAYMGPHAPAGAVRHTWARWTPDSTGEYDVRFHPDATGRGCFAVTEVLYG